MSATLECREVYVPRNRLTGEGGYTIFIRRCHDLDEAFIAWRDPRYLALLKSGHAAPFRALYEAFAEEFAPNDEVWIVALLAAWREHFRQKQEEATPDD